MKFSYYPGCSLHATGVEYDASTRAVFEALEIDLVELEDWVCCGASSAHSLGADLAVSLPAINIALAQEAAQGDMLTPCAACFNRTKAADYVLRHDPARRQQVEQSVEFQYTGQVRVRNPLDVLMNEVGLDRLAARVTRPLTGLKVVSYYGCLLVRPPKMMAFDDPETPVIMGRILQALGADVKPWSYAVDCCGGSASLPRVDIATRLVSSLAEHAREAGAEAIVTACPMCQMNLEMRQAKRPQLPIFYFTELMGLAFDLPTSPSWWGKHLIEPRAVLKAAGLM
ncbi:MAG: CoB--CoM heterodisulfide reductase iron-sulfur subunit B family protein [Thermoflexales bacterium]|nr:CoB--CoM heterodisulfide reductase iron-sulfur subunit B family protein [Thermoflexales bacterium]